jgi:hypothetical protein
MPRSFETRPLNIALVVAACIAAPLAGAQESAPLGPEKPVATKALLVPCCRCADGSEEVIDISTGFAPWRVSPPSGPSVAAGPGPGPPPTWTTALNPARWIHHPVIEDPGTYVYELRFQVRKCTVPGEVVVSGQFSADNSATLTIGTPTPSFAAPGPTAYTGTFSFSKSVGAGMQSLKVVVVNNEADTGLVLRGTITLRCPKELFTD